MARKMGGMARGQGAEAAIASNPSKMPLKDAVLPAPLSLPPQPIPVRSRGKGKGLAWISRVGYHWGVG